MTIGIGVGVDIESGRPIEGGSTKMSDDQRKKVNKIFERQQAFLNDLAGGGGEVVKEVIRLYAARIEVLASEDPECVAYQSILTSVGKKIKIGRSFSALKAESINMRQ